MCSALLGQRRVHLADATEKVLELEQGSLLFLLASVFVRRSHFLSHRYLDGVATNVMTRLRDS